MNVALEYWLAVSLMLPVASDGVPKVPLTTFESTTLKDSVLSSIESPHNCTSKLLKSSFALNVKVPEVVM